MRKGSIAVAEPSTNGTAVKDKTPAVIKEIVYPELERKWITFRIVGTAPLIVHNWSEKAKEMIRKKQQKEASRGRAVRDPQEEFLASLYTIDPEKPTYGFPAVAFKAAAVTAALDVDAKKTRMRAAFHVEGVETPTQGQLIPITYDKLIMREDMVRIGMGVADLRYRGEFRGWHCDVPIRYNARAISLPQLVSLFNAAGFGVGLGEWRPERDGMSGTFEVGEIFDGKQ